VIGQLQTGDEVPIAGRNVEGEWLAIPDAGWVFHDPGWMDVDLPVLSLPVLNEAQVVGPMQPPGTSAGVPAIDALVELVTARDIDALAEAAALLTLDCATNPGGVGGPPTCAPGVADGTPVEVFPVATCELGYAETRDVRANLELALTGPVVANPRALSLYAVFLSDDTQPETFPRGEWTLVFADSTGLGRAFFLDGEGRFVQLWVGCDASAPLTLTRDLDPARWVLRPVVPEGLRPAP